MTLLGQTLGLAGVDMNTGTPRFTFGFLNLYDGVELVALALGLFGIAEFLKSVNRIAPLMVPSARLRLRDMLPSRAELPHRQSIAPDGPRHAGRQPVRDGAGHRTDDRILCRLCAGEETLPHTGTLRYPA